MKKHKITDRLNLQFKRVSPLKRSSILIIPFFFLFAISICSAQKKGEADVLYNDFGYKSSIPIFEQKLLNEEIPYTAENVHKIANSYRLIHDTENAEIWYEKLMKLSSSPSDRLHYAQMLQSNGKYDEAKENFLEYNEAVGGSDNRGALLAAAIERMNEIKNTETELKNETIINSSSLDFSPTYYKDGIVFVSSRPLEGVTDVKKDIWIDDNFMTLFYAENNEDGSLQEPHSFSTNINSKYHEGPVTFQQNGSKVLFTRSNYIEGKEKTDQNGVVRLNVFQSQKMGEIWSEPVPLAFCTNDNDECHPSINSDGTKLFFSSNRPGGYGGMDLYVVDWRENGTWSAPRNLGDNINTKGNEVFPFVHDDGTLYYSSDGWGGLGGLDIFSSTQLDNTYWNESANIGTPFNSSKDDFGFILNVLGTEGYLSSDRKGSLGHDDIYSFNLKPDELNKPEVILLTSTVCVYDELTKEKIENAKISVFDKRNKDDEGIGANETEYEGTELPFSRGEERVFVSNKNGGFKLDMLPDRTYLFIVNKDSYEQGQKIFTTEGIINPGQLSFCIPIKKENCQTLSGIITNKTHGSRIANADVELVNNCTGESQSTTSNLVGEYSFPCIDPDCDEYTLNANKLDFYSISEVIKIRPEDLAQDNGLNFELKLKSVNEEENSIVKNNVNTNNEISESTYPNEGQVEKVAEESTNIEVGTVIELEKIFFDFDDYHIRPEAEASLDLLVGLLRNYPSMKIELSAHTDSRGTKRYNKHLSKRRADYAIRYLMKKGIKYNRITAKGFGESELRNICEDHTQCSEEEHQYNRRIEITVTEISSDNIKILYKDNDPQRIDVYVPKTKK